MSVGRRSSGQVPRETRPVVAVPVPVAEPSGLLSCHQRECCVRGHLTSPGPFARNPVSPSSQERVRSLTLVMRHQQPSWSGRWHPHVVPRGVRLSAGAARCLEPRVRCYAGRAGPGVAACGSPTGGPVFGLRHSTATAVPARASTPHVSLWAEAWGAALKRGRWPPHPLVVCVFHVKRRCRTAPTRGGIVRQAGFAGRGEPRSGEGCGAWQRVAGCRSSKADPVALTSAHGPRSAVMSSQLSAERTAARCDAR